MQKSVDLTNYLLDVTALAALWGFLFKQCFYAELCLDPSNKSSSSLLVSVREGSCVER